MEKKEELPELLAEIILVFNQHFEAAPFDGEGTYMSTSDIAEVFDHHLGEPVERALIRQALSDAKFQSKMIGMKFYWLIQKRE